MIAGRKPNVYLSDKIPAKTGNGELKAQYIKHRGFDDEHYKKMILKYLGTYKEATRKDLDTLLFAKLPDILDEKQKQNKISNLLGALSREKKIRNRGTTNKPKYVLISES